MMMNGDRPRFFFPRFCCYALLVVLFRSPFDRTSHNFLLPIAEGCGTDDVAPQTTSSASYENDSNDIERESSVVIKAAKRLIRRGFLDTNDNQLDSHLYSSWIEDLFTVLGSSFEKNEIEHMLHEVRNDMMAVKPTKERMTNASAVNSTVDGECSAIPQSSSSSSSSSKENTDELMNNDDGIDEMNDDGNNDWSSSKTFTGDRHAAGLLEIVDDPDCLNGEFDVSSPSFDIEKVKRVFVKCRIVVLRNLFSKEITDAVLPKYTRYVQDIRSGAIRSDEGTTTFGGDYFILKEDHNDSRFNYLATKELVQQSTGLLDSDVLVDLLADPSLLGEDMIVNHVGTIHALPGARAQYWHTDGPYLYYEGGDDDDSVSGMRVAGHDLPPYAINMFTPLVPSTITPKDGPTEFCLGSSYLRGHDYEADLPVLDPSLLTQKDGIVEDVQEFEWTVEQFGHYRNIECPGALRRIPLLNTGDALLFDHLVTHRGRANMNFDNPDGRSMIFATYSRKWFRDTNFDSDFGHGDPEPTELEELTKLARYAVVVKEDGADEDSREE